MKHLKPGDFLILFIIIAVSVVSICFALPEKGDYVCIQADGTEYQYPLSKNAVYEVQGAIGITKIQVQDNKVRITDSPCPNKTCINQGWGTTLICLPNNVVVSVKSSGGYDAVAE